MELQKDNNSLKSYLIAVTGSFGAGKSLIGEILKDIGVYVIDTDEIVREILKTKNLVTNQIVDEFGDSVVIVNKANIDSEYIDKKALSNIVFNDSTKRKKLESIIHPEVEDKLVKLILLNKDKNIIAVLIPLLFECKLEKNYDETWCVFCDEKIQLERLKQRGFTNEGALKRISTQLSQVEKTKRADFVINNSDSVLDTKEQVIKRLKMLVQSNRNLHLSFYK